MQIRCEKKTRNRRKRTCKRVHCPITYLRCSPRGSFCSFFYSKTRNTHMGERQMYIHTRWRPFCGRGLTSPDDKPFKEVRGCLAKPPPFPSTFLSFLCFSCSIPTKCSVEITVADTVESLNFKGVFLDLIFNIMSTNYKWNMLKEKKRKKK